ncbi:hypothetical protein EJB05_03065, partial [Eragrostis curvula]
MASVTTTHSWEYNLHKYLLLLATLVATVTYTAGFNPPGGVWQDAAAGHLAGDPIIRDTSYRRYRAFYYTNATAFASSLVVIVLILILAVVQEKRKETVTAPLLILRSVMVLDLFSLMGAYAAGTCRDKFTTVYSIVLVLLAAVYVIGQMVWATLKETAANIKEDERQKDLQKKRKMLMLLATFAASVTYLAGLSAPGGFWNNSDDGHRAGHPVLKGRQDARIVSFFVFNTMAFVTSLLIIVLLLDNKLRLSKQLPKKRLYGIIILALIGLLGAYSAGSCREFGTTIYVNALIFAVLVCIGLQLFMLSYFKPQMDSLGLILKDIHDSVLIWLQQRRDSLTPRAQTSLSRGSGVQKRAQALEKARSLVLLLATLAATITYQAGLDPPGGLWEENGDGYVAGDPILLTTNPRRYKVFFYCNSVAFVASLIAIILVRSKTLHQHNSLEAAMILDLLGLIGAYAAGSCRDVRTSIYAMGLAGAVLVYVVIHVVFFTLDDDEDSTMKSADDSVSVEKKRKRLLLFAILAATITYQAGLTPPGGFRLKDDKSGHHAGDPVLLYNFPRRYLAFFYCNSVSFMLSIALIILLINKNLYRPAIRSHALSVCTAAGMFSLVGAYAAGSTQHIETSFYVFALAAFVLISVAILVGVLLHIQKKLRQQVESGSSSGKGSADEEGGVELETRTKQQSAPPETHMEARNSPGERIADEEDRVAEDTRRQQQSAAPETQDADKDKLHAKRKYLMLLGVLVASVTYQAGLEPPGGVWQGDGAGHDAGNPVMHDNRRSRYLGFFYSNSTSFVASVVVIILLLLELWQDQAMWPFRVMNTTIALDLLGLLVAYAIGSSRSWKTTGIVFTLVGAVLAYVGIHVVVSCIIRRNKNADGTADGGSQRQGQPDELGCGVFIERDLVGQVHARPMLDALGHLQLARADATLERPTSEAGSPVMAKSAGSSECNPWEYNLRKYLLLLATLVATVTYGAGFNPPGGVWQDTDAAAGHLAGDPIIRDTSYFRYLAFFYCNATAFASSLVVIVLILIQAVLHDRGNENLAPVRCLRVVMTLDLLSLMGAYAAGTYRDSVTTVYSSVLVLGVVAYVAVHTALAMRSRKKDDSPLERLRKVLMLLATFAVSVTYLAGLSAPGGFWNTTDIAAGHRAGHAVLKGGPHDARLKAFFVFNTTAFVASLLIIVLLLDKELRKSNKVRSYELYGFIFVALVGLVGAYSAGSCRDAYTTIYINCLGGAVLACILAQAVVVTYFEQAVNCLLAILRSWSALLRERIPLFSWEQDTPEEQQSTNDNGSDGQRRTQALEKARSLVLLLATLAAAITYQAGLDPPGGLWETDGDGYIAGDPILLTTNPRRFKAFFYCNSVAFVASLVAIILVRQKTLHQHNALEAAMILDLFGLIGAYAAGSCRDVRTSIYAMALAGAVLVYVVIHVLEVELEIVEKRRKRLLLFAILAATITYQAGLTPPSGFRVKDDEFGHHAGDPVLLYNSARRYKAFFYCNSVSFMLSIALIILLVNKNLYRPAIQSNALSVCTGAGMFSLVGAYAVGSTQYKRTSVYIFVLAAVVLIVVLVLIVVFLKMLAGEEETEEDAENNNISPEGSNADEVVNGSRADEIRAEKPPETPESDAGEGKKLHAKRKYLMLLGILVASVTYQAGLKPPGGVWQSDGDGHEAGNPVMCDNRKARYLAFFYSNSTSFVASIIVIILLLPESLHKEKWYLGVMNTTIVLDLLGLLVAYAAGSSRSWRRSGYVSALVIAVLAYFTIHVVLSRISRRRKKARSQLANQLKERGNSGHQRQVAPA